MKNYFHHRIPLKLNLPLPSSMITFSTTKNSSSWCGTKTTIAYRSISFQFARKDTVPDRSIYLLFTPGKNKHFRCLRRLRDYKETPCASREIERKNAKETGLGSLSTFPSRDSEAWRIPGRDISIAERKSWPRAVNGGSDRSKPVAHEKYLVATKLSKESGLKWVRGAEVIVASVRHGEKVHELVKPETSKPLLVDCGLISYFSSARRASSVVRFCRVRTVAERFAENETTADDSRENLWCDRSIQRGCLRNISSNKWNFLGDSPVDAAMPPVILFSSRTFEWSLHLSATERIYIYCRPSASGLPREVSGARE